MRLSQRFALVGLALFSVLAMAAPSAAATRLPHRILFVGTAGTSRTAEFTEFFQQHFQSVTVAARDEFDLARAQQADVVVLDWSQSEGTLSEAVSPLGDLEQWNTPTVFLGSAGLLMAVCWDVIGGAG